MNIHISERESHELEDALAEIRTALWICALDSLWWVINFCMVLSNCWIEQNNLENKGYIMCYLDNFKPILGSLHKYAVGIKPNSVEVGTTWERALSYPGLPLGNIGYWKPKDPAICRLDLFHS